MLYFDSLSKKSTPNLSRKNSPSPTNGVRNISKSPCSNRSGSRSPYQRLGDNHNEDDSLQIINPGTHLDPNSTLHQKYARKDHSKSPDLDNGSTLAVMEDAALEEYLASFQPALLGSLGKLNSLGLRQEVDEDVSLIFSDPYDFVHFQTVFYAI